MLARWSFTPVGSKLRGVDLRGFCAKVLLPQEVEIIDYGKGEPALRKKSRMERTEVKIISKSSRHR